MMVPVSRINRICRIAVIIKSSNHPNIQIAQQRRMPSCEMRAWAPTRHGLGTNERSADECSAVRAVSGNAASLYEKSLTRASEILAVDAPSTQGIPVKVVVISMAYTQLQRGLFTNTCC